MWRTNLLCLLTIHGIGFQQARSGDTPGYADGLHERLSAVLGPRVLGDDPNDSRPAPGQRGAVYVQSLWPDESQGRPTPQEGLARLGRWVDRKNGMVEIAGAPLVDGAQRIAHVALVYSHLEPLGPHVGSGTVAAAMAAVSAARYATASGLVRTAFGDLGALIAHRQAGQTTAPGLRVRTDPVPWHPDLQLPLRGSNSVPSSPQEPSGLLDVVRSLENDVAVYVSRNDVRQRVRDFVQEALLLLLGRDDVAAVVLNCHSNGTVIGFDAARALPATVAGNVRWLITAGSPLRKYSRLFDWGTEIGALHETQGWTNFWDQRDPVADPLTPPLEWRVGDDLPRQDGNSGLFQWLNPQTGVHEPARIDDERIDNVENGGAGGLPAHDYWDNRTQFIQPLAAILRHLI